MMALFQSVIVGLLKSYIAKIATQEFAHWAFFEIAEAIVKSTKTEEDDKWLAKIKETVES